jgi:hypothetical protein
MLDEQLSPESTAASLRANLKRRSAQLPNLPKVPAKPVTATRITHYPATIEFDSELDGEMEIDLGPRTPLRRSWMTKVPIVASLHRYFTAPRAHKPSGTRPAGSRVLRRLAQRTPIVPRPMPLAEPLETRIDSQPIEVQPIDAPQTDRASKSFTPPKAEKPGGTRPAGGR